MVMVSATSTRTKEDIRWGTLTGRTLLCIVLLKQANHVKVAQQNCYIQTGELVAIQAGIFANPSGVHHTGGR